MKLDSITGDEMGRDCLHSAVQNLSEIVIIIEESIHGSKIDQEALTSLCVEKELIKEILALISAI